MVSVKILDIYTLLNTYTLHAPIRLTIDDNQKHFVNKFKQVSKTPVLLIVFTWTHPTTAVSVATTWITTHLLVPTAGVAAIDLTSVPARHLIKVKDF